MAERPVEPADEGAGTDRRPDRRTALLIGAGAVGGAALTAAAFGAGSVISHGAAAPTATPSAAAAAAVPVPATRRFRSSMVTMPAVTAHRYPNGTPAEGYLLASPVSDVATGVILDDAAEPVWVDPEGRYIMGLDVQTWRGDPVLTFWAGKELLGHGVGTCFILDTAYRTIATVQTGDAVTADMHEFRLTDQGTALVISYPPRAADLRAVGGPRAGWAFDGRVQEIDIATGKVLLDWSALDHFAVTETYLPITKKGTGSGLTADVPFDPVHVNAIEPDGDALLVSARHTHTVYRIDRTTGAIHWRMGGKHSDFTVAADARFAWQHDARRQGPGRISLFDNHRNVPPGASAGLLLDVDETAMTVEVAARYAADGHFGFAEGSMQLLDGGNVLVGWGKDVRGTEFTAAGEPVLELRSLGVDNYRVRRRQWKGEPDTSPDLVAERSAGALRVYISWNGATEVASWRIATGGVTGGLTTALTTPRTGFETVATVPDAASVRVDALDAAGRQLGRSRVLTV